MFFKISDGVVKKKEKKAILYVNKPYLAQGDKPLWKKQLIVQAFLCRLLKIEIKSIKVSFIFISDEYSVKQSKKVEE